MLNILSIYVILFINKYLGGHFMFKFNSKIYLIGVVIAFVLAVVSHSSMESVLGSKAYVLYYLSLLLLLIPSILFWFKKKDDIKTSKPLLLLVCSYAFGILVIAGVAITKIIYPDTNLFNDTLYYILVYIPIIGSLASAIWIWFDKTYEKNVKIYYAIIATCFSFFLISTLKGFYLLNNGAVSFSAPFLAHKVFWSYLFESVKYFLALISFPFSVYAKFNILSLDK